MGEVQNFVLLVSRNLIFSGLSGHAEHVETFFIKDQIFSIDRLNMFAYKFHPQVLANIRNKLVFFECLCDDIVLGLGVKSLADKFLLFILR